jgi:hypothetical protein
MTSKVDEDEIPPLRHLDYSKAKPSRFANKLQESQEAAMKEPRQQQTAFIDRIEDDIAVLILSDETTLNVPRQQLPVDAKEGDYLQVEFDTKTGKATNFMLDDEATTAAQTRVAEMQSVLSADDDAAPMNIKL